MRACSVATLFATAVVAAFTVTWPAQAGPLLIAPTTVEFAPGRRSAVIEITNKADEPVDLQFRAFAWEQPGADDRLATTDDLAISPPIATVAPHAKQIFRVLDLRDRAAAIDTRERSYRLLLNELPRAGGSSVRINVEFSLPAFVTPGGATAHVMAAIGDQSVAVVNDGTRRLRLANLAIRSPDGALTDLPSAVSTYILAGSSRMVPLPVGTAIPAGTHLVGSSDAGPFDAPLSVPATR